MSDTLKKGTYVEAVGRRKSAVARVRLMKADKKEAKHVVNGKSFSDYFQTAELQANINLPLAAHAEGSLFVVSAKVNGGGISAQSEAVRHGIARALVTHDETLRKTLKKAGYLKRDPRTKERRKFGLKKARRAPQWSKR